MEILQTNERMKITFKARIALVLACILIAFGVLTLFMLRFLFGSDPAPAVVGGILLGGGLIILATRKRRQIILQKTDLSSSQEKSFLKSTEEKQFNTADVDFVLLERYRMNMDARSNQFGSKLSLVLKNGERVEIADQGDNGFTMLRQLSTGSKVTPIFADEANQIAAYLGVSVKNQQQ